METLAATTTRDIIFNHYTGQKAYPAGTVVELITEEFEENENHFSIIPLEEDWHNGIRPFAYVCFADIEPI
ncbi:hypothetical protein CPHO_06990 [Corynebacterium phocae]|uniref:Uncharacterized protein n=1 Tax=Corynebacterium phocae TaxID=161895 RepID=A0A1L7D3J6_9CORY|nr:hypothetical protein [Corynebacterium phocae]APT92680.1 hypothetical protein CPHO_06990 [Corynebacterium phocae]KAA8723569.1 hypothetical protein F4V58_06505 [Corynebacterium phocae]